MNYHQSTKDLNDFILWSRNNEVRKRRTAYHVTNYFEHLAKAFERFGEVLRNQWTIIDL